MTLSHAPSVSLSVLELLNSSFACLTSTIRHIRNWSRNMVVDSVGNRALFTLHSQRSAGTDCCWGWVSAGVVFTGCRMGSVTVAVWPPRPAPLPRPPPQYRANIAISRRFERAPRRPLSIGRERGRHRNWSSPGQASVARAPGRLWLGWVAQAGAGPAVLETAMKTSSWNVWREHFFR